jgi:hypothetical protein
MKKSIFVLASVALVCALLVTACPTEESSGGSSKPVITQQPNGFSVPKDTTSYVAPAVPGYTGPGLIVTATAENLGYGGVALSYQWYEVATNTNTGGTAIANATGSTYRPRVNKNDNKYYYCEVKNGSSSVTSVPAQIIFYDPAPFVQVDAATPTGAIGGYTGGQRGSQASDIVVAATAADTSYGGVIHYKWYCQVGSKIYEVGKDSPRFRPSTAGTGTYTYTCQFWNENGTTGTDSTGRTINGLTIRQGTSVSTTVTIN